MPSQIKENWWVNIPQLTAFMDTSLNYFASLSLDTQKKKQFEKELNAYCEFLELHPLAKAHSKGKGALIGHMKMNIKRISQGLPVHH